MALGSTVRTQHNRLATDPLDNEQEMQALLHDQVVAEQVAYQREQMEHSDRMLAEMAGMAYADFQRLPETARMALMRAIGDTQAGMAPPLKELAGTEGMVRLQTDTAAPRTHGGQQFLNEAELEQLLKGLPLYDPRTHRPMYRPPVSQVGPDGTEALYCPDVHPVPLRDVPRKIRQGWSLTQVYPMSPRGEIRCEVIHDGTRCTHRFVREDDCELHMQTYHTTQYAALQQRRLRDKEAERAEEVRAQTAAILELARGIQASGGRATVSVDDLVTQLAEAVSAGSTKKPKA